MLKVTTNTLRHASSSSFASLNGPFDVNYFFYSKGILFTDPLLVCQSAILLILSFNVYLMSAYYVLIRDYNVR